MATALGKMYLNILLLQIPTIHRFINLNNFRKHLQWKMKENAQRLLLIMYDYCTLSRNWEVHDKVHHDH